MQAPPYCRHEGVRRHNVHASILCTAWHHSRHAVDVETAPTQVLRIVARRDPTLWVDDKRPLPPCHARPQLNVSKQGKHWTEALNRLSSLHQPMRRHANTSEAHLRCFEPGHSGHDVLRLHISGVPHLGVASTIVNHHSRAAIWIRHDLSPTDVPKACKWRADNDQSQQSARGHVP